MQLPRWRKSRKDRRSWCIVLTDATYNSEPVEPSQSHSPLDPAAPSAARRYEWWIAALLLAFGAYQSILLFGHTPVPHPDMPHFVRVGHELLALEPPGSLKRLPVVGLVCWAQAVAGESRRLPPRITRPAAAVATVL